jgi:hypothetical protein
MTQGDHRHPGIGRDWTQEGELSKNSSRNEKKKRRRKDPAQISLDFTQPSSVGCWSLEV